MQQGADGPSSGSVDDNPTGEVDDETSRRIKRKMPLWNPDTSMFLRYLMWLGFAPYESKWIDSHEENTPYRYTIKTIDQDNDQGVPISLQKYIFPIVHNNEIIVYESNEGTDFDATGYDNLDKTDFDSIGYIKNLRVWEPYVYTIKEITQTEAGPILLQKYILMDENMNVYESIECTNVQYEKYRILPLEDDLGEQSESFWKESDWEAKKIDDSYANLSLENKGDLINQTSFKQNWTKSDWEANRISNF